MVLARNISVFLITSGIVLNVIFWMFSFECYLSSFECYLSSFECYLSSFECYLCSLVRTLFSLKVVLFFYLIYIYMKHSRIWDTLPTSKMELFVTIGIYKVILCRLMTQYSPMSAFVCVSSLPAPFCSRWFHLQSIWDGVFCYNNYC